MYWRKIACHHGIPKKLYSDRDVRFTSRFWKKLWEMTGTQLNFSNAYHSQSQGQVERMNQLVEQVIRCTLGQSNRITDWDLVLPGVQFIVNSSVNRSTGFSPFYLTYGYHPITPLEMLRDKEESRVEGVEQFIKRQEDIFVLAKDNMQKAQAQMKHQVDKHRRNVSFKVTDLVLLNKQNLKCK